MAKNLMGKARKEDAPYLTYKSQDGTWTWKVLKSWQADNAKPYGRWLCSVSSPYTHGSSDMGDVYVYEVVQGNVLVDYDHDVPGLLEQTSAGVLAPAPGF